MAALDLGELLIEHGELDQARSSFQIAIDTGIDPAAPTAAMSLGNLLVGCGDLDGAQTAYQFVIDSGQVESAARAAYNLGGLLAQQGKAEQALALLRAAVRDSGDVVVRHMANQGQGQLLELFEQLDQLESKADHRIKLWRTLRRLLPPWK